MLDRREFIGALCALLISGTINPDEIDNELSYSPATPGDYNVNIHPISKLPTVTMELHRTELVPDDRKRKIVGTWRRQGNWLVRVD